MTALPNIHPRMVYPLLLLLAILWFGQSDCPAQAVSPEVYAQRLEEIERRVRDLTESGARGEELLDQLRSIRQSIPAREEVAVDGIRIWADNRWIHREIDSITSHSPADQFETTGGPARDDDSRQSRLTELEIQIARLRREMDQSPMVDSNKRSKSERGLLSTILNQPEYRPEIERESSIREWLRRTKSYLAKRLRGLFPGYSAPSAALSDQWTWTQKFLLLSLVPFILYFVYRVAGRYRSRRSSGLFSGDQEILGLKISPDQPVVSLTEQAARLAETGEYREAIRFSFVASIVELARQNVLTIEPARTNRDYLRARRRREDLLPALTRLTAIFEEFWYGQKDASRDDYASFGSLVDALCDGLETGGRERSRNLNTR